MSAFSECRLMSASRRAAGLLVVMLLGAGCGQASSSVDASPASSVAPAGSAAPAGPGGDPTSYPTAVETTIASTGLEPNAVVVEVIDGDTIRADIGGRQTSVRFIGIDTPEKTGGYLPAECFGDLASQRTRALIPAGTPIYLERDEELYDRYDRLLAYVYRASDGMNVNYELVRSGYADAFTYGANVTYAELLSSAAASAQAANRGLWAACGGTNKKLENS